MKSLLLLLAGVLCTAWSATDGFAQSERGRPEVRVWTSQDWGAAAENRWLHELPDGRMLVSNIGGLMAFDGARWRYWNHPRLLSNLSQPVPGDDGRLYAHWRGDLGWYTHDGRGAFEWHSLLDKVPPDDRLLDANIRVQFDRGRNVVWYLFNARLFRYDLRTGELTVTRRGLSMAGGFFVDGELWVHHDQDLLLRTSGAAGDLEPVPGREPFGRHGIRSAFTDRAGTWVLNTNGEVFRRAPGATTFAPFAQQHWERWRADDAMRFEPTPYGYALLSTHAAMELIDEQGALVDRFGLDDGVPENRSFALAVDRDGGLWIAQTRTIARIDLGRGVTRFDASLGLKGADEIVRWRGVLFVGDNASIYRLRPSSSGSPARFERVLPRLEGPGCLGLVGDRLLVGGVDTYEVIGNPLGELRAVHNAEHPIRICNHFDASRFVPDRLYISHTRGVTIVDAEPSGLRFTPVTGLSEAVYSVAEVDAGTLLVADRTGKVWRVRLPPEAEPALLVTAGMGLPAGPVKAYPGTEGPWLATAAGLRRWDDAARRVVVPAGLPEVFTQRKAFALLEDPTGAIWLRGDGQAVAVPAGSGYVLGEALRGVNTARTTFRFAREGSVVWMARSDDLIRIDLVAQRALAPPLPPLLAKVIDTDTGGGLSLTGTAVTPARNLRFTFSTPAALASNTVEFRTRLSSVEDDFGQWSERSEREVTNLADGVHLFEVAARDAYGRTATRPALRIEVPPPWFRTPAAFVGYAFAVFAALWLAMRHGARRRQAQMLARQQELEAVVATRTAELSASNAQLAQQAERLAEVDRLKTRFFINVGHEFRTPLTLVLGPIDDLLRDGRERISERMRAQLQLVQRNARRVLDLIIELLDVNRFEQGQLRLATAPVDLVQLLHRVADENAPLAERFGQALSLDCGAIARAPCVADALQIERALGNLIGNASKFSPRGTAIEISLAVDGDRWSIAVRDQGRGIGPDALPHVFDRFFQADGSETASGYGVGLALVREIAGAHDGEVSVSSTLGSGSTFTLRLPRALPTTTAAGPVDGADGTADGEAVVADPVARPETAESPGEPGSRPERELVLVIDDNDDLRHRVRDLLGHRFDVIEAADGDTAWDLARDRLPDLVVSDVMMPGCDGVALTRRLRSDPDTATIGILLLTAKVGSQHAVEGLGAGANDYLEKPFDSSELLARCEAIVAHARRLQHRLGAAARTPPEEPVATPDARWRQRLDQHIATNLHRTEFAVEQLAAAMHVDRTQLFRRCKDLLGQSPSDYLRDARLAHGHRLLEQSAGNVSEIAYACGFASLSSFTRAFKLRYGIPPSQVRGAAA